MRRSALSLITSTVVALCIIATAQTAVGDTIVLKDGTIVEGEILRESTRFVKIKTRDSSPVIRAAARKYAEGTQD